MKRWLLVVFVSLLIISTAGFPTVLGSKYPPPPPPVDPTPPPRPSIQLIAAPSTGYAPLTVAFQVMGFDSLPQITWNFGDGSPVQYGGYTSTHTYFTLGTYTATVSGLYNGFELTASRNITVKVNHPPSVSLTASPTNGAVPLPVNFYATASDSDGDVLSYSWSFGDGTPLQAGGTTASYTYQKSGTYYAAVYVNDGRGGTASAYQQITVRVSYRMVFSMYDGNKANLYTMNSDGSNLARITNSEYSYTFPSWSPDGSKITFCANGMAVGVMNADGSNRALLAGSMRPTWSPDGSKIAYFSLGLGVNEQGLYVMNADGSNQHLVIAMPTDYLQPDQYAHSLSWSPDGTRIVYSGGDLLGNIYVIPATGGQPVWLCEGKYPAWSPDGRQIAFARFIHEGSYHWEVFVMNSDGTNQRRITYIPGDNELGSPTWSADGTKIAFEMHGVIVGQTYQIYVMNADGTNVTRLNTAEALQPCFYGKPR